MKILLAILLAFCLGVGSVAADELWIRNEGGLEVVVECEGNVSLGSVGGVAAINPDYGEGAAKVAAATLEAEWVVITADHITGYTIEVACNQHFEDVNPEVSYVFEYDGTRFSFDPATSTKEAEIAKLDELVALGFGPPPAPPSEPIVLVETSTVDYQDYDSGPSIQEVTTIEYDWTGQEVWLWT